MQDYQPIDEPLIRSLMLPRPDEGHKSTFGHAWIMAGSDGKIGAAILAAKAALRSGCGLLSVATIPAAVTSVLSHLPEAMVIDREQKRKLAGMKTCDAIGFGPGIGIGKKQAHLLSSLLKKFSKALVIDADGITLLSKHPKWYKQLSSQIILTPHPIEFDRLSRPHHAAAERFATQAAFSKKHQVIVVLKGHRTTITFPDGARYQNTTGNNGMATAGSGDVLTGIITSLCAQGYSTREAALIGIFAHGYAGDAAAVRLSKTAMLASDIVNSLTDFFLKFE